MGTQLLGCSPNLGTDPELFIVKVGKKTGKRYIAGCEEVVPIKGLGEGTYGKVARDGVQAELHPHPSTCRETLSTNILVALNNLKVAIDAKPGYDIDFRRVVHIGEKALQRLNPDNQVLGCAPSMNFYGTPQIQVDGREMRMRSGSGHFHIGSQYITNGFISPNRLVPILDLVAGIPSVLLTRETAEEEARRREFYGRAGEYRLPKHGLEYRTLSNFWLRSYILYHLMAGQVRNGTNICYTAVQGKVNNFGFHQCDLAAEDDLLKNFDAGAVSEAINKNDFKAAMDIWKGVVRPVLARIDTTTGIGEKNIEAFEFLVDQGLNKFFPDTADKILSGWQHKGGGWEWFASNILLSAMSTAKMQDAAAKLKANGDAREAAGVGR